MQAIFNPHSFKQIKYYLKEAPIIIKPIVEPVTLRDNHQASEPIVEPIVEPQRGYPILVIEQFP